MSTNSSLSFPHETVEFLPLSVTNGSTPVTTYQTAVLTYGRRPVTADWTPSVAVDGEHGFMVNSLPRGTYAIWVRVNANPETPVINAGYINIT